MNILAIPSNMTSVSYTHLDVYKRQPLAGLVAVCAGSDVMHPLGALATGIVAGVLFVWAFNQTQNRLKIDDVLGVWPLHGLCGAWGGIAAVSYTHLDVYKRQI